MKKLGILAILLAVVVMVGCAKETPPAGPGPDQPPVVEEGGDMGDEVGDEETGDDEMTGDETAVDEGEGEGGDEAAPDEGGEGGDEAAAPAEGEGDEAPAEGALPPLE